MEQIIDYMEYAKLVDVLNQWAKAYAAGESVVSDDVYDKNYLKLKKFEIAKPDFILPNSPTRHVEDGAVGFKKVAHEIPMISIANSNGIDEACEWVGSMFEKGVTSLENEYKLDGLGLALKYLDGTLIDSVTRGVDNVGDSVWENALRIADIPKEIGTTGLVEIRGEVVWKFDDFQEFNALLEEQGKKPLSNPRNGAAGALKQHDPEEVAKRKLSFVGYLVVQGSPNKTQYEDIQWLKQLGFNVPPSYEIHSVDEFRKIAEEMRSNRYNMEYAIDGEVIKVNVKDEQPQFGYTAKTPNFYRAYKFPPEEKVTKLIAIEESVGMSGAVTPVAIVEPVNLAMTTVQRCTLHNWDLVEYLGLYPGCNVVIRKAGEIIPEIVCCVETNSYKDTYEVIKSRGEEIPKFYDQVLQNSDGIYERAVDRYSVDFFCRPTHCPYCGNKLSNAVNANGEKLVAWVCDNPDCYTQLVGQLTNFASRSVMNIRGLGESVINMLVDAGKVRNCADIYTLTADDFNGLGNIREKSANNLVAAIAKSKENYLHQLIEGLSIPGIGHSISPLIAQCVATSNLCSVREDCCDVKCNDFKKVASECGVSDLIINKFVDWMHSNLSIWVRLMEYKVATEVKQVKIASNALEGRVCIMTGTFDMLDRDEFKRIVVENGGTICSGITKKTNLVLLGDSAGPKKVAAIKDLKAAGYTIDVITPAEINKFYELIGGDK